MSGMTHEQKACYIFGLYDFDESCTLSLDELTLALRSTVGALCKMSAIVPPLEADLEHLAFAAF
eukprot:12457491-Prorocentrum_lima.AAC.1